MEFTINNSPELSMADITKLLFNRNFLSDVQFHVDGKTIYAHSLELMKRSIVFQKQLVTTLGENKLIPINDASYDNVYQFVHFIYTDECTIDKSNAMGLLKLAKRYKIIKLENQIVCAINGAVMNLMLYEYCLLQNDQCYLHRSQIIVLRNLENILPSKQFLTIQPAVVEEILKSDYPNVSEYKIFTAVARWIDKNSNDNQIDNQQIRDHYENFIRLIRFPLMSAEELFKCTSKYPHLFNGRDLVSFFREFAETSNCNKKLWNAQKRNQLMPPYIWSDKNIQTIFTVSREMVFYGLRFGSNINKSEAEIIISQMNLDTNIIDTLNIKCATRLDSSSHHINLGESIRLKPNMQYTVEIKYKLTSNTQLRIASRDKNVDIYTNISRNFIEFVQVSRVIYEMYFELLDD